MAEGSATSGRGEDWVGSHWKALVSIAVATALIAVAIVVLIPTHRATLRLEFWGGPGTSFTLTIDGHLVENENLPGHNAPLWLTINVTWKGNDTHLCSIVVVSFSYGTELRQAQSVWLKDGATVSESYDLNEM